MSTTTSSEPSRVLHRVLEGVQYARGVATYQENLAVALHPEVEQTLRDNTALDGDSPIVSILGVPVVVTEKVSDIRVVDFGRQSKDL